MTGEMIAGVVRHILTTVGGVLVAKGYIDEGTMTTIVGGAAAAIGFVWSWIAKRNTA
jgi:hypothetical protein